jgi:hypothetical protein
MTACVATASNATASNSSSNTFIFTDTLLCSQHFTACCSFRGWSASWLRATTAWAELTEHLPRPGFLTARSLKKSWKQPCLLEFVSAARWAKCLNLLIHLTISS